MGAHSVGYPAGDFSSVNTRAMRCGDGDISGTAGVLAGGGGLEVVQVISAGGEQVDGLVLRF